MSEHVPVQTTLTQLRTSQKTITPPSTITLCFHFHPPCLFHLPLRTRNRSGKQSIIIISISTAARECQIAKSPESNDPLWRVHPLFIFLLLVAYQHCRSHVRSVYQHPLWGIEPTANPFYHWELPHVMFHQPIRKKQQAQIMPTNAGLHTHSYFPHSAMVSCRILEQDHSLRIHWSIHYCANASARERINSNLL